MRPEVLRRKDYTAEEAFWLDPPGRWDLVAGEFRFMSPVGFRHGDVVTAIAQALGRFVRSKRLGRVLTGDPGFILKRNPDTVRAPDVAFVRRSRVPRPMPEEFMEGAPDLAIEVLSPRDRWPDVEAKAQEFLAAGAVAVWAVDPGSRTARIYTSRGVRVLAEDEPLSEPSLLPRFSLSLRELLEIDER